MRAAIYSEDLETLLQQRLQLLKPNYFRTSLDFGALKMWVLFSRMVGGVLGVLPTGEWGDNPH